MAGQHRAWPRERLTPVIVRKYAKAFAALLGALTPPVLLSVSDLAGLHWTTATAAGLIGILSPIVAMVATALAPANELPAPPAE